MKKLFLILAIVALVFIPAILSASDFLVGGKTFTATYDGSDYQLAFTQGPFGPGEGGTVQIFCNNASVTTLPYQQQNDPNEFIIDNTSTWYYAEGNLVWVQGNLLILKGPSTTVH